MLIPLIKTNQPLSNKLTFLRQLLLVDGRVERPRNSRGVQAHFDPRNRAFVHFNLREHKRQQIQDDGTAELQQSEVTTESLQRALGRSGRASFSDINGRVVALVIGVSVGGIPLADDCMAAGSDDGGDRAIVVYPAWMSFFSLERFTPPTVMACTAG